MNKIERVTTLGGLIGWLIDKPHQKLNKKAKEWNDAGLEIVQIIPDGGANLIDWFIRLFILCITLGLFTIASGYIVVLRKFDLTSAEGKVA